MATPKKKTVKRAPKRPMVIIRGSSSGCHVGSLVSRSGTTVELADCRRIWRWCGAQTLDELAVYGSSKIGECKIAPTVARKEIIDACEVIYCQPLGYSNLMGAAEWRA